MPQKGPDCSGPHLALLLLALPRLDQRSNGFYSTPADPRRSTLKLAQRTFKRTPEFQSFTATMRRLIAVPKKELDDLLKAEAAKKRKDKKAEHGKTSAR